MLYNDTPELKKRFKTSILDIDLYIYVFQIEKGAAAWPGPSSSKWISNLIKSLLG